MRAASAAFRQRYTGASSHVTVTSPASISPARRRSRTSRSSASAWPSSFLVTPFPPAEAINCNARSASGWPRRRLLSHDPNEYFIQVFIHEQSLGEPQSVVNQTQRTILTISPEDGLSEHLRCGTVLLNTTATTFSQRSQPSFNWSRCCGPHGDERSSAGQTQAGFHPVLESQHCSI